MTVQFLHVRNPFRPDLAAQPDDILLLLRIQSRKNGLKRIGLGQRELVIPFVNVSHVGSGIHHLAAFPDRLGSNFIGPIPEMNDSTCIQLAERRSPAAVIVYVGPQDFIPPHHPAPPLSQHAGNPIRKHDLKVGKSLNALFLHERFNVGHAFPVLFVPHLVTADVNDTSGKEGSQLCHDVSQELVGTFAGGIKRRSVIETHGHFRERPGGQFQLRIGNDGGGGMARNIYFRNNRYVPVGRIPDNAPDLFLRIKTFMGPAFILAAPPRLYLRISSLASHGCQFGIFFNLDAPSGIIRQMPVQDIHFQEPHLVNQPLHLLLSKKMPCFIQHEGSPGKTGIIQYGKRLHRHIPTYALFVHAIVEKGGRQHLRQTLPCIINSFGSRGADDDISGSRFQTVCLRPVLLQGSVLHNADYSRTASPVQSQSGSA